jgi:regulator of protease activity HflC (stomatin/prohibitin superfamily)
MSEFATTGVRATERAGRSLAGIPVLVAGIVGVLLGTGLVIWGAVLESVWLIVVASLIIVVAAMLLAGLYMLQPNTSAVLTLFGDYRGTVREPGMRFSNPFYAKRMLSLRVRNFVTTTSKVNDANGNPIMIAAVAVWQVVDTARAVFDVDDFEHYVTIQAESAVRHLARSYPYDSFEDESPGARPVTLVGDVEQINESLTVELEERLTSAGVRVVEARLTDLSYAPEIAEAMLRRQQAAAVVAARKKIVEGAVAMVRDAIQMLEAPDGDADEAIPLDQDRKATFASNLMTVIAADQPTTPVVNVGTLAR